MRPVAARTLPTIGAVVPVLDEAASIGWLITGLRSEGACCVFVVDGGSGDGTQAIAAAAGGVIVPEPRRGYGRACLTGAERAIEVGPEGHVHDAVVFLDGDGSCDPSDLPDVVAMLSEADVVLGRRPGPRIEPGAMPWHARLGNRIVAAIVSRRTGRIVHDLPPFKAARAPALRALRLDEEGYGWTVQFVARALLDRRLEVHETSVGFRRRRGGVSKVSGSWRASAAAALAMLTVAVRETRRRPLLALMAKSPRPGHAKTRLAVDLGAAHTADLWAACLDDIARTVERAAADAGWEPAVMVADEADAESLVQLLPRAGPPLVQRRVGLANALVEVFLEAFDRGTDRAAAVAADNPSLQPDTIVAALGELERDAHAAVLGPTPDGGFHLVGLRWRRPLAGTPDWLRRTQRRRLEHRLRSAFDPGAMGGSSTLETTGNALTEAGWDVGRSAAWPDLDTIEDLRALDRSLEVEGPRAAPSTAAWIGRHRDVIEETLNRPGRPPPRRISA
jgi:glycosyltransferase A (GT-A) superfamily protein (DUF2064 family)